MSQPSNRRTIHARGVPCACPPLEATPLYQWIQDLEGRVVGAEDALAELVGLIESHRELQQLVAELQGLGDRAGKLLEQASLPTKELGGGHGR